MAPGAGRRADRSFDRLTGPADPHAGHTAQAHPGCVHWHIKHARNAGTLELTAAPAEQRIWFKVQTTRDAPSDQRRTSTAPCSAQRAVSNSPELLQILETRPDRLHRRRVVTIVLLNQAPLHTDLLAGGEDRLEVENPRPHAANFRSGPAAMSFRCSMTTRLES